MPNIYLSEVGRSFHSTFWPLDYRWCCTEHKRAFSAKNIITTNENWALIQKWKVHVYLSLPMRQSSCRLHEQKHIKSRMAQGWKKPCSPRHSHCTTATTWAVACKHFALNYSTKDKWACAQCEENKFRWLMEFPMMYVCTKQDGPIFVDISTSHRFVGLTSAEMFTGTGEAPCIMHIGGITHGVWCSRMLGDSAGCQMNHVVLRYVYNARSKQLTIC